MPFFTATGSSNWNSVCCQWVVVLNELVENVLFKMNIKMNLIWNRFRKLQKDSNFSFQLVIIKKCFKAWTDASKKRVLVHLQAELGVKAWYLLGGAFEAVNRLEKKHVGDNSLFLNCYYLSILNHRLSETGHFEAVHIGPEAHCLIVMLLVIHAK